MATQSLRECLLEFMTNNPTAWRKKALADELGVDVKQLGPELSRLNAEGKLVSCTVEVPDGRAQGEYRIAANVLKVGANRFVINRGTNGRLNG